ncbi:hypothetical protein F442_02353 [Phytophthora nicotianae P10297]|uniref:Uncharacterized protein n=1 Tax=Phytophthora nicotianae P10297 TaxID=1317064 RepID=W2ZZ65_PHYNI|nr:hypothetical protein F442_02353 [Phytophthora nicotianae P10297]
MDVQTEKLRLAMDYAEQRQYIIDALGKQIERKREVFKTTVSANTENTCKLHDLLLKSTQGTWVDANTAALIADPTDRNLQLLRPNRALQGFVSFAGMNPTLVIQGLRAAEAGDQEDPFALAEALIKTAQQVQSSASKRSRHGSNDGSSDDTSEEKTPIACGCVKSNSQSPRSSHVKGLEEQAEVQASEDCLALAGFRSFTLQPGFSPFYISAARAFALGGPRQIARESPEVSFAFDVKSSAPIEVSRISNVRSCYSSQG